MFLVACRLLLCRLIVKTSTFQTSTSEREMPANEIAVLKNASSRSTNEISVYVKNAGLFSVSKYRLKIDLTLQIKEKHVK